VADCAAEDGASMKTFITLTLITICFSSVFNVQSLYIGQCQSVVSYFLLQGAAKLSKLSPLKFFAVFSATVWSFRRSC